MKNQLLSIAIVAASSLSTAQALEFAVGTKAGTQGAGFEVYAPLHDKVNLRAGTNSFETSFDQTIDGIAYTGDISLNTIAFNADYHPFGGVFRLTAGLVLNSSEMSGTAEPGMDPIEFEIGGNSYSSDDVSAEATITFPKTAPYLGFGFDRVSKTKGGFGISAEVGVMFQGTPDVDFQANYIDTPSSELNAQLNSDINAEIDAMKDDLSEFNIYPVASLGLTYQF